MNTDERSTPQSLFDELNNEFHFTVDVAATSLNTKCARFFSREDENGLITCWKDEICFMNPPYSNLYEWLQKASKESLFNGSKVVCILPCDTSTKWFHDFLWNGFQHCPRPNVKLRFPKGR